MELSEWVVFSLFLHK